MRARRAADHDPLTGIANRACLMRTLQEAMNTAESGERVALLFGDLDGFKVINDTFGHHTGDTILHMAASRIANAVRAIDVAGRLGGDEFGVLVRRIGERQEAMHMVSKLERAFADPFHSSGKQHRVGITIGVSLYPDDAADAETLLQIADERMYFAKQQKRSARL